MASQPKLASRRDATTPLFPAQSVSCDSPGDGSAQHPVPDAGLDTMRNEVWPHTAPRDCAFEVVLSKWLYLPKTAHLRKDLPPL
jgi:hypothetical protein